MVVKVFSSEFHEKETLLFLSQTLQAAHLAKEYSIHEGVPSEQFQMVWKSEMVLTSQFPY